MRLDTFLSECGYDGVEVTDVLAECTLCEGSLEAEYSGSYVYINCLRWTGVQSGYASFTERVLGEAYCSVLDDLEIEDYDVHEGEGYEYDYHEVEDTQDQELSCPNCDDHISAETLQVTVILANGVELYFPNGDIRHAPANMPVKVAEPVDELDALLQEAESLGS